MACRSRAPVAPSSHSCILVSITCRVSQRDTPYHVFPNCGSGQHPTPTAALPKRTFSMPARATLSPSSWTIRPKSPFHSSHSSMDQPGGQRAYDDADVLARPIEAGIPERSSKNVFRFAPAGCCIVIGLAVASFAPDAVPLDKGCPKYGALFSTVGTALALAIGAAALTGCIGGRGGETELSPLAGSSAVAPNTPFHMS